MERSKVVTMNSQPVKRNLLTVDQAWEEVFERSISKTKLYQMLQQGKVPAVRIGAKYLLRRESLESWFRQQEEQGASL